MDVTKKSKIKRIFSKEDLEDLTGFFYMALSPHCNEKPKSASSDSFREILGLEQKAIDAK